MAKYTTTIKTICESLNEEINASGIPAGLSSVNELISNARPYIFDFNYPLFSENHEELSDYKEYFESKILKYYYMREIGCETVAQWKLQLDNKLNEIMPYYNQLFESELLQFPVFENVDVRTNGTITDAGSKTGARGLETQTEDSNATTGSRSTSSETITDPDVITTVTNKHQDTPQGSIANLEAGTYLSDADINETKTTGEDTTTNEGSETTTGSFDGLSTTTTSEDTSEEHENNNEHEDTTKGKNSGESYSEMLIKYRETFLNIEKDILEDLSELFMLIY